MKTFRDTRFWRWFTLFSFVLALYSPSLSAANFVHVAAEIQFTQWGANNDKPNGWHVNCTVGTNGWEMEAEFLLGAKSKCWFTGTKLIMNHEIPRAPRQDQRLLNWKKGAPGEGETYAQIATPYGQRWTSTSESADGNPSQGPGILDRMTMTGRIAWLAFCSGPCLKRDGRHIYPPSDVWKEYDSDQKWSEKIVVFKDAFGLPRRVTLTRKDNQPILDYRVTESTNVFGWEFPLAFEVTEYLPRFNSKSNASEYRPHLTVTGKVTEIGAGIEPRIPSEVLEAIK